LKVRVGVGTRFKRRVLSARVERLLEKVKAFFYALSVSDADRENILSRKVIFSIEAKFCQEAKDNVRLFVLKKVVSRINRLPAFIVCFLHSLKTDRSRFYCININNLTLHIMRLERILVMVDG
jgi:hypothetical protein